MESEHFVARTLALREILAAVPDGSPAARRRADDLVRLEGLLAHGAGGFAAAMLRGVLSSRHPVEAFRMERELRGRGYLSAEEAPGVLASMDDPVSVARRIHSERLRAAEARAARGEGA